MKTTYSVSKEALEEKAYWKKLKKERRKVKRKKVRK